MTPEAGLWNVANVLTIVRIVLVPVFVGFLLAGGTASWALSKLVKQMVRRPRPATLVSGAHSRGRDASGLGYLSGHAGVAVALGTAAFPRLSPSGRAVVRRQGAVPGLQLAHAGRKASTAVPWAGGRSGGAPARAAR